MNRRHKLLSLMLALTLTVTVLPTSAYFFGNENEETEAEQACVATFAKNGTPATPITFSSNDFLVIGEKTLDSILITQLPAWEAGVLTLGGNSLTVGDAISRSALSGLQFQPLSSPSTPVTSFSFTPFFSDGTAGEDVTVDLHLLTAENSVPVAEHLSLSTYKNIAVGGRFSAVDPEGDLLTFRIIDKPARGAVTLDDEGSADFVYTPYENKTGKDSFTYVAVDSVGNVSAPATVKIRIEKPRTSVTYTDMDGQTAHKAALRLAEEEIFIGECLNGEYFFRPDEPVTRSEFVAMALKMAGQEALTTISRTGFADDAAIPTWAKGYVASGLKSGVVRGTIGENGLIVFQGADTVTRGEASVLLDRVLQVTSVSAPTFYSDSDTAPAWAYQAAVNLETAGVLQTDSTGALALSQQLNRADAAELLANALELLDSRAVNSLFS